MSLQRANIVLVELAGGKMKCLHVSEDPVAAIKTFSEARADAKNIELVLVDHGHISRVARPALEAQKRKEAEEAPKRAAAEAAARDSAAADRKAADTKAAADAAALDAKQKAEAKATHERLQREAADPKHLEKFKSATTTD